jgi:hypothetical protein
VPRSADAVPALEVDGEVAFVLEAPDGTTSGTVSGQGRRIVVRTDDPVMAFRSAVAPSTGGTSIGALADLLAASGLVVEVCGPEGTIATLGDGVDSQLGRLVAGSRRVRPGAARAVRPLAVAQARSGLGSSRRGTAVAVVLLLAAAIARRTACRR